MSKKLEIIAEGCFIPAIPLAQDNDGNWDKHYQKALLLYYLAAGVGGIAVGVHTTQFSIRNPEHNLLEALLELVANEIDRHNQAHGTNIVKVAGVCGPTKQALAESETAKRLGYDAVLLSPAGLREYDDNYLVERTKIVASSMPVIGFYLQPLTGGRLLSFEYWQQICAIENVIAIKCAAFERYQTLELVRAVATSPRADKITLYTGNDDNIVLDLVTSYNFIIDGKCYTKSFEGGLLGHWSVWTKASVAIFHQLKKAKKDGKITPQLLVLANQVTDANGAIFDAKNQFKGCIAGVHEVLLRQGLRQSIRCLDPEETLSPGQKEEIDRIYAMYPHLTSDDDFISKNLFGWLTDV